jgi:hypothetical protein
VSDTREFARMGWADGCDERHVQDSDPLEWDSWTDEDRNAYDREYMRAIKMIYGRKNCLMHQ